MVVSARRHMGLRIAVQVWFFAFKKTISHFFLSSLYWTYVTAELLFHFLSNIILSKTCYLSLLISMIQRHTAFYHFLPRHASPQENSFLICLTKEKRRTLLDLRALAKRLVTSIIHSIQHKDSFLETFGTCPTFISAAWISSAFRGHLLTVPLFFGCNHK